MGFIDPYSHPVVKEICESLVPYREQLIELSKEMNFIPWYEPIYTGSWDVASIKYKHHVYEGEFGQAGVKAAVDIPLVKRPEIQTFGFSRLSHGVKIAWHKGFAGDIWRLHFGLICPKGDLALQVGDEVRTWEEGKFLMFNDLEAHRAWNFSGEDRLVLLVDIDKSKL